MTVRVTIGVLIAAMLGALAWLLVRAPSPEIEAARRLAGERWYQLFQGNTQVGYMHTNAWTDRSGSWHFESLTHFMVQEGYPVSVSELLRFGADPPHALELAEHWNHRRASPREGTVIGQAPDGLEATFVHGPASRTRAVAWEYLLADYLAFEIWLDRDQPAVGRQRAVRSPGFERGELVAKVFEIADRNATGYKVMSPAPLSPTVIQLDRDFAPVTMTMAGLFTARHSDMRSALSARTPLHLTDYVIPLDERLVDHGAIERLELEIVGTANVGSVWPAARQSGAGWTLELRANPVSVHDDPRIALGETLSHPVSHPAVQALLHRAGAAEGPPAARLEALVAFVHEYLDYSPSAPPSTVLETIETRYGECTEFADLLTTVARAAGIPARTVIGLAYSDRATPVFAFHAWNEVALDGVWQSVDPTWNQLRVDATHMPLPVNEVKLLRILQGGDRLRFRVRSVRYFQGERGTLSFPSRGSGAVLPG